MGVNVSSSFMYALTEKTPSSGLYAVEARVIRLKEF
jgi:hypothetical protein